jgi:hypothetical protein
MSGLLIEAGQVGGVADWVIGLAPTKLRRADVQSSLRV